MVGVQASFTCMNNDMNLDQGGGWGSSDAANKDIRYTSNGMHREDHKGHLERPRYYITYLRHLYEPFYLFPRSKIKTRELS